MSVVKNMEASDWKVNFTFLSLEDPVEANQNAIDRALRELKLIQKQNSELNDRLCHIRQHPQQIIQSREQQLLKKIREVKDENHAIRKLIETSKYPGYTEMSKKKIVIDDTSPSRNQYQSQSNSFVRRRDHADQNQSNYSKNQRSTCLNYKPEQENEDVLHCLNPLTEQENNIRRSLVSQFHVLMTKYQIFRRQIQSMADQRHRDPHISQQQMSRFRSIEQYKTKLLRLLNKLKTKESQTKSMVRTYQKIHAETVAKLEQATNNLQQLQQIQIAADVDQQYAQIVELQERLSFINSKLEQFDEGKWLSQILKELTIALERAGMEAPKHQNSREAIEEICEMLIECMCLDQRQTKQRVALLKDYYEQENQNHQKTINTLKAKEQALAKKLLDMQMGK